MVTENAIKEAVVRPFGLQERGAWKRLEKHEEKRAGASAVGRGSLRGPGTGRKSGCGAAQASDVTSLATFPALALMAPVAGRGREGGGRLSRNDGARRRRGA